ncbi:hypothetical protein RM863_25090 [Streptomyces sp. DSM 41014]|uniref:Uncharacterized protein n=1 Tax=Streptomyces hintoniae TaxID=3075521 RepID=A0ABU2URG7_9ACTN|nr:hypothetical protein [Streptomyces sp. DSM 41014]MDT0475407.1 hypothetical protein [Streptomyces sp. DSM 41014]
MVFGRNKDVDEPAVPVVPWADAWEFAITDEERPITEQRRHVVLGARAVRVPHGRAALKVNAPCAFFAPQSPQDSTEALRLYEDAEGRNLLCAVDDPVDANGARDYTVRDGQGHVVGTVRRMPPLKHALKPTWRFRQPGRPEIVSSAEWAKGGVTEMVQKGAGKLLLGAVQAVADMGAEGGDQAARSRVVEWRADGETVMTSDAHRRFLIRAAWLDRRVAFAYAMLRA